MSTAAITYLGTKYYNGGWSGSFDTSKNSAYVGVNSSSKYTLCFKVTLPSFSGVSESVAFTFPYIQGGDGYDSSVYLHAAVTTAEDATIYGGTSGNLSDPNAIVLNQDTDVLNCSASLHTMTITFTSAAFASGGTYYIYLYGSGDDTDFNVCQLYNFHSGGYDASFSLTYQSGLVYIDNGSGWDAYQTYIDNGSGWDLYIPYVDNGSGWDILA